MATVIKMPKIGLSEESSLISKWHKAKGDPVKVGEILFTIETDKSTFDVEAEVEGTILEIFYGEGDEVSVLGDVCVIGSPGETFDIPSQEKAPEKIVTSSPQVETQASQSPGQPKVEKEIIKISPRARNLADKEKVDLSSITPTGPEGRIIERDILDVLKNGPILTPSAKDMEKPVEVQTNIPGTGIGGRVTTRDIENYREDKPHCEEIEIPSEQSYTERSLSKIRKIIAANMLNSLSNTAQLTINTSFDATAILSFRKNIKKNMETYELENITLNDIVLYAVSRTLLKHKDINAHFLEDKMLIFHHVNLGVAVDTERGLMVPTIFNADTKSLNEISKVSRELVSECKNGSINPELLKGGTFTVTNMGSFGVESFTPILNPPQTGILGVNTITNKVKVVDGNYEYYPAMGLSLTFDHRAIDGAPAARFLQELKMNLEHFELLLAK